MSVLREFIGRIGLILAGCIISSTWSWLVSLASPLLHGLQVVEELEPLLGQLQRLLLDDDDSRVGLDQLSVRAIKMGHCTFVLCQQVGFLGDERVADEHSFFVLIARALSLGGLLSEFLQFRR